LGCNGGHKNELICRECKMKISNQVDELKDLKRLNENNGQDYIPEGFFTKDSGDADVKIKGFIIINIKDLINSNYHMADFNMVEQGAITVKVIITSIEAEVEEGFWIRFTS
jgi:hypothetical protein